MAWLQDLLCKFNLVLLYFKEVKIDWIENQIVNGEGIIEENEREEKDGYSKAYLILRTCSCTCPPL